MTFALLPLYVHNPLEGSWPLVEQDSHGTPNPLHKLGDTPPVSLRPLKGANLNG